MMHLKSYIQRCMQSNLYFAFVNCAVLRVEKTAIHYFYCKVLKYVI